MVGFQAGKGASPIEELGMVAETRHWTVMGKRVAAPLLALALLLAGRPAVAQQEDRFAGVRATIERALASTSVASITVAVAKDGKILWEEGFGFADREANRKADAHTMYSLASISKPITATGLMMLVEQGKVSLDKPANDYLGRGKISGLAGDARQATVRRVLSHTAGLPLHYQFFYADQSYRPPTMDETISRYGNVVFAPGSLYEYSNLGFGIIDHIVERVSGQPYAAFMRNQVFLPLGLTHTSIDIAPGLEQYAAQRYDAQKRPIPFYAFDHMGASAVYSSAHDLVRFGMFHLKNKSPEQKPILKDATIDLMHTRVPPAQYGLGWGILDNDLGFRRVSHTGGMPGVSTVLNLYPSENLAVVVLTSSGAPTGAIAQEIAAAILPAYADSLRARRAQLASGPPAAGGRAGQPPSQLNDVAGEWVGTLKTWKATVPFRLSIGSNGEVFATVGDQARVAVNQPALRNNRLSGRFTSVMPTDDVQRWAHTLALGLQLVDGVLKGQVSAQTSTEVVYYSLASYAELRRQ
ncbi:MAG: serine hydrolase domain-containing protein [Longimicrobiales bacterium]